VALKEAVSVQIAQTQGRIEDQLQERGASYPLVTMALRTLLKIYPGYAPIAASACGSGASYWVNGEARCREILYLCEGDVNRFQDSVREWVRFSFEFLRKQRNFLKTGRYAHEDFEEVRKQLYDNTERMERSYLIALMFSFAFSTNYVAFFEFFRQRLLPRAAGTRTVCDVGCGHGVYLAQMLLASPSSVGTGIDISAASLTMTERLLHYHQLPTERYRLEPGDLRGKLPLDEGSQEAVTCFEVIEHLEDPGHALGELRRVLRPGGALCLSTAIRMESVDHIHVFRHPEEVRAVLRAAGLGIRAEDCIPLTTADASDPAVRARLIDDPGTPLGFVALAE
jgi:2-polyprenyl-3-methyl-5-hydroxy-6-metoxy-1,4-benzoquinol methylase